jgi:two-component system, OmpR family, alkaline phosphatase synthesis response regulator PhoP
MERILVVDDDKEIVRLVKSYLEKSGFEVFSAFDGETALHVMRREMPDLLVLDLMLPDRDGWDITRLIRSDEHLAGTPIIMLTARVEDSDKIVGLEIGADDYITKPFNPREVVARVRALLRRSNLERAPVIQQVIQRGPLKLDIGKRKLTTDSISIEVTPSEFEVLRVLMESPGFVFTRSELMDKALGYSYDGLGRALDSHIKNLRRKFQKHDLNQNIIETIYSIGYRFSEDEL